MKTKLVIATIFTAATLAPAASAQWADGEWAYAGQDDTPSPAVVVPVITAPEDTPTVEEPAQVVTVIRPPAPCNPLEGCGLAPGQVVISPSRVSDFCNPYRLEDACNAGKVPPGSVVVNPPRAGIPCSVFRPDHCEPGELPI